MASWRWVFARSGLFDALVALGFVCFVLFGTAEAQRNQPDRVPLDPFGVVLLVLAAGTLVFRRRWPLVTLGVVVLTTALYLTVGFPYGPVLFPPIVATYSVGSQAPVRRSLPAAAVATLVMATHMLSYPWEASLEGFAWTGFWLVWLVLPWALGTVARQVRDAQRAAREEENRERAYEERLRVAQEVHDVVGHGLAAISMQAQIALHVVDRRPEQARVALEAISQSSHDALEELRGTLAMFRSRSDPDGEPVDSGRRPSATLAQLDRLVSRLASSGLTVTLEVAGERPDLPAAVDLAGYRIVQESLTNVLRHAGPAQATVRVRYRPESVILEITDNGSGPTRKRRPAGAGHGIAGMIERATALGGDLVTGPRSGGGFRVHARLPVKDGRTP